MLLSVLSISLIPLIIDQALGDHSPFLFNAGIALGNVIGLTVFLLLFYRRLILDRSTITTILHRSLSWGSIWRRPPNISSEQTYELRRQQRFIWSMILGATSQLAYACFGWSTQFVDSTITTILFGTGPIFGILLMARIIKNPDKTYRYYAITKETLVILTFAFIGLAFLIAGTTGTSKTISLDPILYQLFGILLAILAAIIASLNAFGFRWGKELSEDLASHTDSSREHSIQLACVLIGWAMSSLIAAPISIGIALLVDGGLSLRLMGIAIATGCMLLSPSVICFRKAIVQTDDLAVISISYTTPIAALIWLALFSVVELVRADYVVIGATAIIAMNLVLNIDPERRVGSTRRGFKALILSLWLFGVVVYLRDDWIGTNDIVWNGSNYWGLLALSATVFILILSFRIARLVDRTTREEYHMISLLRRLEVLHRHGIVSDKIMNSILDIDTASSPKQLERAYTAARPLLAEAWTRAPDVSHYDRLAEVEEELDTLVHSKQYGTEFAELIALVFFGLITVGLGLAARPNVEGWSGFLAEVFSLLFAGTIVFLLFNLYDMRQERSGDVPKLGTIYGIEGYAIALRSKQNLAVERYWSLAIGLGVAVSFGFLLYDKWLG